MKDSYFFSAFQDCDDEDYDSDGEQDQFGGSNVAVQDAAQATIRLRGKILRDRLKDEMPQ